MQLKREIQRRLSKVMDVREAAAVAMLLFEDLCSLRPVDVLTGKDDEIPSNLVDALYTAVNRIVAGEPVQYVLGTTRFMDLTLNVGPSVLIPRPETEFLVRYIIKSCPLGFSGSVLDIGTGSGAIALSLKQHFPDAEVFGWDVMPDALSVAKENAQNNHLDVTFRQMNILTNPDVSRPFDLIVSNPPYVCESEARDMESNVKDFEPHIALFVPDDNPLLFYDAITRFSLKALNSGGYLFFETNCRFAQDIGTLLTNNGFVDVKVLNDQYDNPRIVSGKKRNNAEIR